MKIPLAQKIQKLCSKQFNDYLQYETEYVPKKNSGEHE